MATATPLENCRWVIHPGTKKKGEFVTQHSVTSEIVLHQGPSLQRWVSVIGFSGDRETTTRLKARWLYKAHKGYRAMRLRAVPGETNDQQLNLGIPSDLLIHCILDMKHLFEIIQSLLFHV